MSTILIVDDDDQLRLSFHKLLAEEGYTVESAAAGDAAVKKVEKKAPDLVILDMRLPGMNGLEAFRSIHRMEPKLPVIIMTAYGTTENAIEATKLGAFDYVLKPFEIPAMLTVIRQALEAGRFMRSPVDMNGAPDTSSREAIVGRSRPMQDVYKAIGRVSSTEATVLIRGESGTGKELAARAVYSHSLRADKPFQVINCVAIPETLLESELFGFEKGAFTGAAHRRVGKIEQANGGTVFLDEIGDMPFGIQSKILRLLQERSIERLGGRETIPVDVRIIAATNRDLETALEQGRFREDLYYRLKVVTIALPAAAGAPGRHPAAGGLLPETLCRRARHRQSRHHAGGRDTPQLPPLAGQRPRAGQRRPQGPDLQPGGPDSGAGNGAGRRRRDHASLAVGGRGGPDPAPVGAGGHHLRRRAEQVRGDRGPLRRHPGRRGPEPHPRQPVAGGEAARPVPADPALQDRKIQAQAEDVGGR